jgi:hypothetical protein
MPCTNSSEKALFKYPQPDIAKELIQGLKYGFKLQYSGPHRPFEINLKEIVGEKAVVTKDKIYTVPPLYRELLTASCWLC